MVADFNAHPKPKKWKFRLRGNDGQFYVVENICGRSWHTHRGHIWELISGPGRTPNGAEQGL